MTSQGGGLVDAAMRHVTDYALSPATLVTHLAMFSLVYAFVVDGGLRRHQLTLLLLGEELFVYFLWLAVDHGLRAPFAIWVYVSVYETIVKPRIRFQDRAVLLTGNNSSSLSVQCCYAVHRPDIYDHFGHGVRCRCRCPAMPAWE